MLSVALILVAGSLIATVSRRDRRAWRDFWALRGQRPARPTVLATIGLAACAACRPGRIRRVWAGERYEIWEADVPLATILDPEPPPCSSALDRGT